MKNWVNIFWNKCPIFFSDYISRWIISSRFWTFCGDWYCSLKATFLFWFPLPSYHYKRAWMGLPFLIAYNYSRISRHELRFFGILRIRNKFGRHWYQRLGPISWSILITLYNWCILLRLTPGFVNPRTVMFTEAKPRWTPLWGLTFPDVNLKRMHQLFCYMTLSLFLLVLFKVFSYL